MSEMTWKALRGTKRAAKDVKEDRKQAEPTAFSGMKSIWHKLLLRFTLQNRVFFIIFPKFISQSWNLLQRFVFFPHYVLICCFTQALCMELCFNISSKEALGSSQGKSKQAVKNVKWNHKRFQFPSFVFGVSVKWFSVCSWGKNVMLQDYPALVQPAVASSWKALTVWGNYFSIVTFCPECGCAGACLCVRDRESNNQHNVAVCFVVH